MCQFSFPCLVGSSYQRHEFVGGRLVDWVAESKAGEGLDCLSRPGLFESSSLLILLFPVGEHEEFRGCSIVGFDEVAYSLLLCNLDQSSVQHSANMMVDGLWCLFELFGDLYDRHLL